MKNIVETSNYTQLLLEQITALLNVKQNLAAMCNFYLLIHMSERGFLEKSEIAMLIKMREHLLLPCDNERQKKTCERLLKISETNNLGFEQAELETQLGKLCKEPASSFEPPEILFTPIPKAECHTKQIEALAFFTKSRQTLMELSKEKREALLGKNTKELNKLEIESQYDLVAQVYIEQLINYHNQHYIGIENILKKTCAFIRKLRNQGLFKEAQSLFQYILKKLDVNQSFYETTCLKNVNERFLLQEMFLLHDALLKQENRPEKNTFFWQENLNSLKQIRKEKKVSVNEVILSIDKLRHSEDIINNVEELQKDTTQSMKAFFTSLFKQAEETLGKPPCDYCVIALGSIARGDMTPYSDLESVLLVEKPCVKNSMETLYFERLWKLFEFQIRALGESYEDVPGIHIDAECYPLLPGSGLINTPENLIANYGLKKVTTDECSEGTLALTLLNSTVVYSNEVDKTSETLFEKYKRLLNDILETEYALRQKKAHEQLWSAVNYFKTIPKLVSQNDCSIKTDFLAPLSYLLADLALYHNLDETNHSKIIELLTANNVIDKNFSKHLRAAIAELNVLRLHQHLENNQAQDVFSSDLSIEQQERLTQIWQGIIKPLYDVSERLLQTERTVHPVFDGLSTLPDNSTTEELTSLCNYLLYTQNKEEPFTHFIKAYHVLPVAVRPVFLRCLEGITQWPISFELKDKTLTALEAQANPNGWQPRMEKEEAAWKQYIDLLFESQLFPDSLQKAAENGEFFIYMHADTGLRAYKLKQVICAQLFDNSGKLKKKADNQAGRHHILPINNNGKILWFKFKPEQAGTEFAISRLERYLGGQGTPMTQIVNICRGKEQGMAAQIMEHALGETLEKSLAEYPEKVAKIDMASFTQTLLRVLLTNPEDDKGDDYFLVQSGDKQHYFIIRIDNERAFFETHSSEGFFRIKTLQVKSILYCLNQMQEPLDPQVLEAFLRLDTFAMLKSWLQELEAEHTYYQNLFDEEEVKIHFQNKIPGASVLGIPMAGNLIEELLIRLDSMQEVILLANKNNRGITGIDLLKVVQPILEEYYQSAFDAFPAQSDADEQTQAFSVLNRFNKLTDKLYEKSPQGHRQSSASATKAITQSLRLKTTLKEKDILEIYKGTSMSPIQALKTLAKLQIIKLDAIEEMLLAREKSSIKTFQQLPVRHQMLIIKQIAKRITVDKEALTRKQQNHCLKAMVGVPFHVLTLSHFKEALNDSLLNPILKGANKHLLTLDISDCEQITDSTIRTLPDVCPHLETLKLRGLPKLTRVGYILDIRNPLVFPNLKSLNTSNCTNLTSIRINAAGLKELLALNCSKLNNIQTNSLILSSVDLTNCSTLTENGINKISALPYKLRSCKFGENSQVPHAKFREKHPHFANLPLSLLTGKEYSLLEKGLHALLNTQYINETWRADNVKQSCAYVMSEWLVNKNKIMTLLLLLKRALRDKNEWVRRNAVLALVPFSKASPQYIPELLEYLKQALKDEGKHVRLCATKTLGPFAQAAPEHIPELLELLEQALSAKDKNMRRKAATALGPFAQAASEHIPILFEHLKKAINDDVKTSKGAVKTLGYFAKASPENVPILLEWLKRAVAYNWTKKAAIKTLEPFAQAAPEHIPIFFEYLKKAINDDDKTSKGAIKTLGYFAQAFPENIPILLEWLKLAFADNWAIKTLVPLLQAVATEPVAAILALKKASEDSYWGVHPPARTLVRILCFLAQAAPEYTPELLELLRTALENDDYTVRQCATNALGTFAQITPQHISILIEHLKRALNDPLTRVEGTKALRLFTQAPPKYTPELLALLKQTLKAQESKVRKNAALTLGPFAQATPWHTTKLFKYLKRAIKENVLNTIFGNAQDGAVKTLSSFAQAAPEHIPELFELLKQALHDKNMCQTAVMTLGPFAQGSPEHIPELLELLKNALRDKECAMRSGAAESIGPFAKSLSVSGLLENFERTIKRQQLLEEHARCHQNKPDKHKAQHTTKKEISTMGYIQHGFMKPPSTSDVNDNSEEFAEQSKTTHSSSPK